MNESELVAGGGGEFFSMETVTAAAPGNGSLPSQVEVVSSSSASVGAAAAGGGVVSAPESVDASAAKAVATDAMDVETGEGEGSEEEKVVPAELYKTATEAQAHGEPYFLYREETTGETNAMPVKKQPLQYVPKHLDWYCSICHFWVDDEQDVCVSQSLF